MDGVPGVPAGSGAESLHQRGRTAGTEALMSTLFYALGGGLGHLTRVAAFCHTQGIPPPIDVITASMFGTDARVLPRARVHCPDNALASDPAACRGWLRDLVHELRPEHLVVDVFPGGIVGELDASVVPDGLPVTLLARRLHWPIYRPLLPGHPVRFDQAWLMEGLDDPHGDWIRAHADIVDLLDLEYPLPTLPLPAPWREAPDGRRWLVVHTGPPEETLELVAFAQETARFEHADPVLFLVTPQPPPGLPAEVIVLDLYPAAVLFSQADRLVTACGYNVMAQTRPYAARHVFMPMPRRFDDQFARAAERRAEQEALAQLDSWAEHAFWIAAGQVDDPVGPGQNPDPFIPE